MNNQDVKIGRTYEHSSGLLYRVDKLILDATYYETKGLLEQRVLYTQLEDGKVCKKGTQFVREVDSFLSNFRLVQEG